MVLMIVFTFLHLICPFDLGIRKCENGQIIFTSSISFLQIMEQANNETSTQINIDVEELLEEVQRVGSLKRICIQEVRNALKTIQDDLGDVGGTTFLIGFLLASPYWLLLRKYVLLVAMALLSSGNDVQLHSMASKM